MVDAIWLSVGKWCGGGQWKARFVVMYWLVVGSTWRSVKKCGWAMLCLFHRSVLADGRFHLAQREMY